MILLQDCSAQYLPFGYYNNFGGGYPPYYSNYYGYGGYNNYYNYGLGGWGRAARTRRQDIPGIYCSHAKFCG
uniref:Candidate secreted effector n=1 Tax=Meloidogyne incognita TaxID=6306 RepID=A0A914L0R9_MELIC